MIIEKYELINNAYLTSYYASEYRIDTTAELRPIVIICPGGGWYSLSEREGEPVALKFATIGYHACVLHYSTYNHFCKSDKEKAPYTISEDKNYVIDKALVEFEIAYELLQINAQAKKIDINKVIVLGFSAGGQLASLFSERHKELMATVLCYPMLDVSSVFEFYKSSMCKLDSKEILSNVFEIISIDEAKHDPIKCITKDSPPHFIWHGRKDELIPPISSLNYVSVLEEKNIKYEFHLYDNVGHGISLGTKETAAKAEEISAYGSKWFKDMLHWLNELMEEADEEIQ